MHAGSMQKREWNWAESLSLSFSYNSTTTSETVVSVCPTMRDANTRNVIENGWVWLSQVGSNRKGPGGAGQGGAGWGGARETVQVDKMCRCSEFIRQRHFARAARSEVLTGREALPTPRQVCFGKSRPCVAAGECYQQSEAEKQAPPVNEMLNQRREPIICFGEYDTHIPP